MELGDLVPSDWSWYVCNQPPVELDTSHLLRNELGSNNSGPYSGIQTDAEQLRVKSRHNQSFAMDARIRLDSLKSGCTSPSPCCARDGMSYSYEHETDLWDSEESQDEERALDSVELLDVEDDVQDEEKWLYESPKKQACVDRTESALRWCRRVLDNRSPETEAACRSLIKKLGQRSNSDFYRRPALFHRTDSAGSSMDKTHNTPDSAGNNELNQDTHDSIATSYRLQDITDVHVMARMQEASLRQDYVSTPASASPRRGPEPPAKFGPSSLSSPPSQSLTSAAKQQGCQSPKLTRLHQQVTQFKLLKLAQNQATSAGRTRSPLRTSLRSLQAVRNSRSLDTDDYQPADSQITYPPSGVSSVVKGSSCWSPSLSAASIINFKSSPHSVRDSSDRTASVKRLHRSQSVSPCRIPHPAKGYLSAHGRIFASPERSTAVAWNRNGPSTQR